jgi:hypothetical protein
MGLARMGWDETHDRLARVHLQSTCRIFSGMSMRAAMMGGAVFQTA